MNHVSRSELRRFIVSGFSTTDFERHVDGCTRCAQRLQASAQRAVMAPRAVPFLRFEAWCALAAAVLLFAVWPRMAVPMSSPRTGPVETLAAGVPDAGQLDVAVQPFVVAALDAGGAERAEP